MKINKVWTVIFDKILAGQCFEWNGCLYIKAYSYKNEAGNIDKVRKAVDLKDGEIVDNWDGEEECTLYENAEVKLI